MRKLFSLIIILNLSLYSLSAGSQENFGTEAPRPLPIPPPEPIPVAAPPTTQTIPKLKSWYLNFGGGVAIANYSQDNTLQNYVNVEKNASAENLPVSVDLGIYVPLVSHVLIGLADSGFNDAYAVPSSNTSGVVGGSVVISNIMLSLQYFLNNDAAWGWFFRGDIGFANSTNSASGSYFASGGSTGTGVHFALGYSFPILQGAIPDTRIPIYLGYFSETVGTGIVTAGQLSFGFMF